MRRSCQTRSPLLGPDKCVDQKVLAYLCSCCFRGVRFNRGTLLLDQSDPILEPLGKLSIFVDLGCHEVFRACGHTMALLRAIELALLAARTQKRANRLEPPR